MLQASIQITDQDARTVSSVRGGEKLGQLAGTADGRLYKYALAGGSNLSAALLTQIPATTANHVNRTGVAYAAGSTSITFTIGATVCAADLYAEGYLSVNDGPGPNLYKIKSNTAVTSAGGSITVTLSSPITVATTTSSKFSLYPSPFSKTVVMDYTAAPAIPVNGVPNVNVTAGYYYWSQIGGYCTVLNDGAISKNAGAIPSNAVNGSVEIEVTGTVTKRVGYAPELTVDQKYYPIVLTLA